MTTTKEDQIRAEFEALIDPDQLAKWEDIGEYKEYFTECKWRIYKTCAESYEKKLSEANARNVRLVEAIGTAKWMLERDYIDPQKYAVIEKCEAAISANSEAAANKGDTNEAEG